jgi:2-methylaconitate cis-trans-isomerase PrpF
MQTAISCTIMRGGTSKGLYFDARHLPDRKRFEPQVCVYLNI